MRLLIALTAIAGAFSCLGADSSRQPLADVVARIKPSIVGIGTYQRTRTPPVQYLGTGFVVGDGNQVLTCAHVIPKSVDEKHMESLVLFARQSDGREIAREIKLIAKDDAVDAAYLRFEGTPMPAMTIGDSDRVREGEFYAFTGFPIGMVLGLHPVTHRGMISAIAPDALPVLRAQQLQPTTISRLNSPLMVFQLDATAYPGNSGSPLYDIESGKVVGIINKVFVQESKEALLEKPSGISYAIPIARVRPLLTR